ncbi:hypothetical protein NEOLEDRAFT_1181818 [Neolentinus lepideus HHB14362 ss-1]|uniref:Uncharacterized protein n=1 Tax=Neolentinus lepideus HHB14362 ss-1 TaxID=1314782 RepID=A0A165PPY2_9AGAM|nr:hypothetical protein NEOLEDRAFT_1181818 [Neolentinus lepideus HHB14362 ss-1]
MKFEAMVIKHESSGRTEALVLRNKSGMRRTIGERLGSLARLGGAFLVVFSDCRRMER